MLSIPSILHTWYRTSPGFIRHIFASVYAGWSRRYKYGAEYERWRGHLAESQWWDADRMNAFQRDQLGRILALAASESPYYSDLLAPYGISPDGDPFELLRRIPVTGRREVQSHSDRIRTRFARNRRLVLSTSGTTGALLRIPFTREAFRAEYAFRWHHFSTGGAVLQDRFATFTGHEVSPVGVRRPPYYIRNFVENIVMFSVHHLSEDTLPSYADSFNRFRPAFVFGYPSSLSVFSRLLKQAGRSVRPPHAVFTSSEKLHPAQRALIQDQLGARVYDLYGQVEHVAMLHECEEGRLHVKEDYGYLELLNVRGKPSKPGEMGSVVATGWLNAAFPLLRYRLEDNMVLAADQRCSCGRNGRIIAEVLGRDDDLIVTPDGRYLGSLEFLFAPAGHILECQIVQEQLASFVVRVVPGPSFSTRNERSIVRSARTFLGKNVDIRVEQVTSIPRTRSGKVKYVISRVKKPWQEYDICSFTRKKPVEVFGQDVCHVRSHIPERYSETWRSPFLPRNSPPVT